MKKSFKTWVLTLIALLACNNLQVAASTEKSIKISELPAAARNLLSAHFGEQKVALARQEGILMWKSYEVIFTNGDKIDFDSSGQWEEIDMKKSGVPTALVPGRIVEYVAQHFPHTSILKIERNKRYIEVKLSNRTEVKFDKKYQLIDID